ncbi:MAG: hypothetical protein JKP90_02760 [Desulfofustis sp. PB-SRB1]|jgi:hypothetical protein|nr:hypothetical protein [Desulfofustis sp. PB-SRB1]
MFACLCRETTQTTLYLSATFAWYEEDFTIMPAIPDEFQGVINILDELVKT